MAAVETSFRAQPFSGAINKIGSSPEPMLIPSLGRDLKTDGSYGDFRDDLARDGFVVVKGVIPKDRAIAYQEKAHQWLKSFPQGKNLDFNKPETWVDGNLPRANVIRVFDKYGVTHEKFMWDARQEQGVIDAFASIWGTEELLVSFDGLNVTFPNRKDIERRRPWEHIDQSPLRRGMHCVQGIINLSPSGPEDGGLVVFPGSHKVNDEFFDAASAEDKQTWLPLKDQYLFRQDELEWFDKRNVRMHKVIADVGDLILWDSRVIHYGAEPTEKSNQIRTIIYAAYAPAEMARPEQLVMKQKMFNKYAGTTHWPHDHIIEKATEVILPDGTRDPHDRDEPVEKPELTDKLLKLAGVLPY